MDLTPSHDRTQRYQTVSFETVTVDDRGQVISRGSHKARQLTDTLRAGVPVELILIPAGAFWMGSRAGTGYEDELPRHRVSIPPFLMGKVPVTQAQWAAVMDRTPPYRCTGATRPADRVSWHDAVAFFARLSEQTGAWLSPPQRGGVGVRLSRGDSDALLCRRDAHD